MNTNLFVVKGKQSNSREIILHSHHHKPKDGECSCEQTDSRAQQVGLLFLLVDLAKSTRKLSIRHAKVKARTQLRARSWRANEARQARQANRPSPPPLVAFAFTLGPRFVSSTSQPTNLHNGHNHESCILVVATSKVHCCSCCGRNTCRACGHCGQNTQCNGQCCVACLHVLPSEQQEARVDS